MPRVRVGEVLAMPAAAPAVRAFPRPERCHTCHECQLPALESFMHNVSVTVADYSGLVKRLTFRRVWVCDVCYAEPAPL